MEELIRVIGKPYVIDFERTPSSQNQIDASQRKINELCGISDETFLRYCKGSIEPSGAEISGAIDETQRSINKMMGIRDEVFLKYHHVA